ncbi:MAG: GyrI-like domain-containing protein [Spirochaetaceae bacterium]
MKIHPDYYRRVNAVIDYIEEHIDEKLSLDSLAEIACFSGFHFHRVFKAVINETLNDYIRRVRLEKAARMLKQKKGSVTDVAYSLGYSSSANFARDFRSYFRIPPSKVGSQALQPERRPTSVNGSKGEGSEEGRKSFHLDFTGIMELPDLEVLYLRTCCGYRPEYIQQLFCELLKFASDRGLITADSRTIGIGYDDPDCTPAWRCRYDACLVLPPEKLEDFEAPFRHRMIPGGIYAGFSYFGTAEQFWPAWDRVFSNWLVGSSWLPENHPHLEYYLPLSYKEGDRHRAELLLPIRPLDQFDQVVKGKNSKI